MATERITRYVRLIIDASGAKSGSNEVKRALDDINSSVKRTASGMDTLKGVFAAAFAAMGVRELARYADTWSLIAGRLAITEGSAAAAAVQQERLLKVANSARASLESTASLYARLANATKDLGFDTNTLTQATEAVALSFRVGGASSSEAASAAIQLAQGLGSGALQGDELKSVLENNIPLARIIAKEFGVNVAQLRDLGSEGKLTADRIIPAVVGALDELRGQAGQIPETISGAFQVLENEFIAFVGHLNEMTGASDFAAKAIIFLAENLDSVAIFLSVLASTAIPSVIAGVRALTLAMAANPILLIATAAALAITALYQLKDVTVSFGGATASIGSIVLVVWEKIRAGLAVIGEAVVWLFGVWKDAWAGIISFVMGFFDSVKNGLSSFLDNWGISLDMVLGWIKSAINSYIWLYVGLVSAIGPVITEGIPALFRLAMATAKNVVISAIEGIVNAVVRGLGGIGDALDHVPGIDGVGDSIREKLTIDLSDLRADTKGLKADVSAAGAAISNAFSGAQVDYVGALGEAVSGTSGKLRDAATEIVSAAAQIDAAGAPGAIDTGIPGAGGGVTPGTGKGTGGGSAGGGRAKAAEEEAISLARVNAELDKGIRLAGMYNSEREIEVELRKHLDDLAKAGITVTQAETDALRGKIATMKELEKLQGDILSNSEIAFDGINKLIDGFAGGIVEAARKGTFDFRAMVADIFAQMAKLALNSLFKSLLSGSLSSGGAGGGIFGGLGKLLGFAQGGEFTVGGGGATDSKVVAFRASPGERVRVDRPDQNRGGDGKGGNFKIVNVLDPAIVGDYLKTDAGEQLIMNVVNRSR